MIKKLIHFSDLHIRLFKDHDLYKSILETAIEQWKELEPDRIVFTGDLVHSKNQMTPELIEMVLGFLLNVPKLQRQSLSLETTTSWKTICPDLMLSPLSLILLIMRT